MSTIHIETARLIIRSPVIADAQAISTAIHESGETLRQWLPWANPLPTLERTTANLSEAIAQTAEGRDYRLVLCDRAGNLIGSAGLHDVCWRIPRAEIGYWIHQRHSGCGLMSEAVEAIVQYAASRMGMRRIAIVTSGRNQRSWRIPERLGFQLEGVLREHRINPDGRVDATRIYAHIPSAPQAEEPWAGLHRRAVGASG